MAKSSAFDWDGVRSDKSYPTGYYNMEVEEHTIGHSTNGNKQYTFTCRISEPADFEGMPYFERITVGTEEDPDAEDPKTWKTNFGCGRLKSFYEKCGLKLTGSPDEMAEETEGAKLCMHLGTKVQTKGKYAGETNQTSKFYKLGEREAGLIGEDESPRRARRTNGDARPEAEAEEEPPRRRRAEPEDDEPRRGRRA